MSADPSAWIIHSPLDMHLHLRQGAMLNTVAPSSAELFAGAVIMPNLVPPVTTLDMVLRYRHEILSAAGRSDFAPLMTLFFRGYSRDELIRARDHIVGIKLYPEGITTNSSHGVRDIRDHHATLRTMEELRIPLLVHGETHGFVMDREREFLGVYEQLANAYPDLMIVMEHITSAEAVHLLDAHKNLFATVTLHHLLLTLDDMAGGLLNPHLFCKPILKRPEDRDALQCAVLGGHPKLSFGSDSAPHPVDKKECCGCAAGVFTAPVSLAMRAEFFDRHGQRNRLQGFVSDIARRNYRIHPPAKQVALERIPWTIPDRIGSVVPFMAGHTLPWSAHIA